MALTRFTIELNDAELLVLDTIVAKRNAKGAETDRIGTLYSALFAMANQHGVDWVDLVDPPRELPRNDNGERAPSDLQLKLWRSIEHNSQGTCCSICQEAVAQERARVGEEWGR